MSFVNAIGRRKTSVARVYLKQGSGKMLINNRVPENYLKSELLLLKLYQPFTTLGLDPQGFDLKVNVDGGGITGQAEAMRLGISRALLLINGEHRPTLKKAMLLTVDSRVVERKKYGRKKARRSFQFSKR
jgi:small subunit ribosomal protein S9